MNIQSNGWNLTVDVMGGRIVSLFNGQSKVFGTYSRMDGKSGNTHLCIPSFDKEGIEKYHLPFHGLVRNDEWKIKNQTDTTLTLIYTTTPSDSYPSSLIVEQEFRLEDVFTHTTSVLNDGTAEIPVDIGYHYYWDTPRGWDQIKINDEPKKEAIQTNGYIDLGEITHVTFPHATYEMRSNGFKTAVLWTSFKMDEKGEKEYSQDFCCIEPVLKWPDYFGSKESILLPQKTVSASISIKKVV